MSWIGAGVLLIIVGLLAWAFLNGTVGIVVGLVGAACLLVALVKSL